jgi:demethylmenaquinone methyltransferase/2-methoxy-6-polyprenyl-1,4-benzoquinol methylase
VSVGYALRHIDDLERRFVNTACSSRAGACSCSRSRRPGARITRCSGLSTCAEVVPVLARAVARHRDITPIRYYWDTIEACAPPRQVLATLGAAGSRRPSGTSRPGCFRVNCTSMNPGAGTGGHHENRL